MGRRELVIAVVFVVLAFAAYQLTAPPPKEGEEGFSISRFFSGIRKEIAQRHATGSITRNGTIALKGDVNELRLIAGRSVPIAVTGEKRDDVAYELWVQSNGPDEESARKLADETKLYQDDLGSAIAIKLKFPDPGEQTAKLALRVPEHVLVRFEGAGRVAAVGVRAVEMRNLTGEAILTKVRDVVKGTHRTGDLAISHAGGVDISTTSSTVKLDQISGPISVNGRNGSCTVTGSSGTIDATALNLEFAILDHAGPVRVSGEGSVLRLVQPSKELSIDVRRMKVEIILATAVPATVLTSEEALKLLFTSSPSVTIDAALSEGGEIRASDLGLTPARADHESKLSASVGSGGPRMLLRNTRGDIVIGLRK
jgi:hypothetical protein